MHHDRFGIAERLGLLRQFQCRQARSTRSASDGLMLTQELFGDGAGRAFDLDLVDQLLDHAPFLHARGLAAKFDRQFDLDQFIDGNAGEIDVDHVGPLGVPLHLADEGRFG